MHGTVDHDDTSQRRNRIRRRKVHHWNYLSAVWLYHRFSGGRKLHEHGRVGKLRIYLRGSVHDRSNQRTGERHVGRVGLPVCIDGSGLVRPHSDADRYRDGISYRDPESDTYVPIHISAMLSDAIALRRVSAWKWD